MNTPTTLKEIEDEILKIRPKKMPERYLNHDFNHKKEHSWVAHCDENGDELWGYCEYCGVTR